jgi:GNAT superfamily N-acetyltransferase
LADAGLRIVRLGFSRGDRMRFWRAGLPPYVGDPHFVVPLFAECSSRWNPQVDPFFRHAEVQHFVAVRDGRDVGRIAATVDRVQDEVHGDRTGLFGWFETENRPETAHALLDAAAVWLRERGRDRVRGPLSYTTNGISGLLVRDDRPGPPVIDMAYNPRWYQGHLESWGLVKAKDLLALWIDTPAADDPRLSRIMRRILERGSFTLRSVRTDARGFADDVEHVLRIYNSAWEKNWGFVPMTPEEIRHQARTFKPILVPEFLIFAERQGVPVGFALTLPDANVMLARIRGRLWPWSVLTLRRWKRRIRTVRIITLGVLPEWRGSGLDATLIQETIVRGRKLGTTGGECSWMLEDNEAILASIRQAGGTEYRRYRVYEKAV